MWKIRYWKNKKSIRIIKYRQDHGGFYIMWKLQREGFNWNMMGRLNFSRWNDTQLEMTEVWSMEKTRLASDFYLEVTLRNRDGNFETRWLLPQCLWNRNSSAIVMEPCLPFQSKLKKPMSTRICAGNTWVTSMCVAGLLSGSRRRIRSAAVCTGRPGVCSAPSAPWKTQVSPGQVLLLEVFVTRFCSPPSEADNSLLLKYLHLHCWSLTFVREVCVHTCVCVCVHITGADYITSDSWFASNPDIVINFWNPHFISLQRMINDPKKYNAS